MNLDKTNEIEYGPMAPEETSSLTAFYGRMLNAGARLESLHWWRKKGEPHSGGTKPFAALNGSQIVGALNTIPARLTYRGVSVQAAWQQESVVDPAMRGKGVGKKLVNIAARDYEMVMAKGTSDMMYGLRKSEGFVDVANSNYLIHVLSPVAEGRSFVRRMGFLGLYCLCTLKRKEFIRTGLKTQQILAFGDEFDFLGENLSKIDEIRLRKDRNYLNWRYFECPGRKYLAFRVDDGEGLRGAVVMRPNWNLGGTAWIVDMICDSKDEECLHELLNAAFQEARAEKAGDIRVFSTSNHVRAVLLKRGFIRTNRTPRFTFRIERQDIGFDPRRVEWNFCHGDGDIELYD